jgi:hypothetical protein
MVFGKIRGIVAKFVVVAALAIAVGGGSVAMIGPADASAAPKYTCEQAYQLGRSWDAYGSYLYAHRYIVEATYAFGKATAYFDYC